MQTLSTPIKQTAPVKTTAVHQFTVLRKCKKNGKDENCDEELKKKKIYPKKNIPDLSYLSSSDGIHEKEADAIANDIMSYPLTKEDRGLSSPLTKGAKGVVLQTLENSTSTTSHIPGITDIISSAGEPIDNATREFMETRFGYDFRNVKIHNNHSANRSSENINALAYTYGRHIVFASNYYQPNTFHGRQLLAHELTHVIQQNTSAVHQVQRKANNPKEESETSVCEQYIPEEEKKITPAVTEETEPVEETEKPQPKASKAAALKEEKAEPKTPEKPEAKQPALAKEEAPGKENEGTVIDDPQFTEITEDIRKKAKKQRKHDKPDIKTSEGRNAAEKKDETAISQGAVVLTVNEDIQKEQPPFNADNFKKQLKNKIFNQVPNEEPKVRAFIKTNEGVNNIVGTTKTDLNSAREEVVSSAKNITDTKTYDAEKTQQIAQPEGIPLKEEKPGTRPVVANPERAVPKPSPPEDIKMDKEHDADSLEKGMKDNNLTDSQLANSNEPQFLDTLGTKQTAQKELCQVPAKLKEAETAILTKDNKDAQKSVNGGMNFLHATRKNNFKGVDESKGNIKTEEEKRLEDYYKGIKSAYALTEENVTKRLKTLEENVTLIFQNAIDGAFGIFKKNVTDRLEYYYDWQIIERDYEKEDKFTRMVNAAILKKISKLEANKRSYGPDDPKRIQLEQEIAQLQGKIRKLIINQIFDEEKERFVSALNISIDLIAILVSTGLNDARNIIAEGKKKLDEAYNSLSDENKKKAKDATDDFAAKYDDLKNKVNDKEGELVESLAQEYIESTEKLKKTFEDIRAEASLKWYERAWRKIKEVATIIYDLGKLLYNILAKAVSVIGDILAHPIRFVENLIDGISAGFSNFKKRIGDHLRSAVFELLLGAVPPGLKMPTTWDEKGIFDFVLNFFGLSKENIRQQAVDRFGEPIVAHLEKAFDLFVIFKNEGFAGLWNHIRDRIGDLKNQIIEEAKTYFKQAILQAAVEFLLSILTPVGGFIKACKTIINIVSFFIKNLGNLLRLLDSILDSIVDIAKGNIQNAALKVETSLRGVMVLGIKFLAALVGISFDKIQTKISRVINAVRNPINRAIKWLFDKAADFARRTGLLKVIEKGKAKFEAGKEFVTEKVEAGKEKVKAAAVKLLDWLKIRRGFTAASGESHTISVEEEDGTLALMLESNKKRFQKKVKDIQIDAANQENIEAKKNALIIAKEIDKILGDDNNKKATPDQKRKISSDVKKLIDNLILETSKILPKEKAVETFLVKVGDFIEVSSGGGWVLSTVVSVIKNTTKFDYQSHKTARTKVSGTLNFEDINRTWQRTSEQKAVLTPDALAEFNAYTPDTPWQDMRIARAVLNYRRWEIQRNFDATKEWEHKIEQSTGLPEVHSAKNLFWTDADFNRWLGTELGRPRQKEIVVGNMTKWVSWREYFVLHGTDEARQEFKDKLYKNRGYREIPHHGPRGYWQELAR